MLKIVILGIIILLFSTVLMCIKVLSKRDGRISGGHIGDSEALKKQGIGCARTQDMEAQVRQNLSEKINK
jgi:hypothetical protein